MHYLLLFHSPVLFKHILFKCHLHRLWISLCLCLTTLCYARIFKPFHRTSHSYYLNNLSIGRCTFRAATIIYNPAGTFMNYVNGELRLNKPCFGTKLNQNFVAKLRIKIWIVVWRNSCVKSNFICSLPAQSPNKKLK